MTISKDTLKKFTTDLLEMDRIVRLCIYRLEQMEKFIEEDDNGKTL